MGILDTFRRFIPGTGPETKEKKPVNHFSQIPPEYQDAVSSLARVNYYGDDVRKQFPEFENFLEAMSEAWLEKKKGFEEEATRLGFMPIIPGTKASAMNKRILAFLTTSSSYCILGPGAFDKNGEGARMKYEKISLRKEGPENFEVENGVIFASTPKIGQSLNTKGKEEGSIHTTPLISAMMYEMREGESIEEVMGTTQKAVAKRFIEANEHAHLVPASTRQSSSKK